MHIITKYNNLNGQTLYRGQIRKLINEANQEGIQEIVDTLSGILRQYPDLKEFRLNTVNKVYRATSSELNGLEEINGLCDESLNGVNPDEIYQYVTDLILDLITKDGGLKWDKPWLENTDGARNYVSGKAYRGINSILLNYIYPLVRKKAWESPYFLTFKQVDKLKGKIKKGTKGIRVMYFTVLYKFSSADDNIEIVSYDAKKFIAKLKKSGATILKTFPAEVVASQSKIPILKYYNVFNLGDIEGVPDKKIEGLITNDFKPLDIADAIIENMPKKPPVKHGGNKAFYQPTKDIVQLPKPEFFKSGEKYYATAFHELVHATGHKSRVGRSLKGRFGSKDYAFEELIAELGAAFLTSESGILNYHIKNTAAYLKGWSEKLTENLKEDNRFFFRAASQAQKAADFILDRSENGIPKYHSKIQSGKEDPKPKKTESKPKGKIPVVKKETKKMTVVKPTPKKKKTKVGEQMALFGFDKPFVLPGFESAVDIPETPDNIFTLPTPLGKFIQIIQAHQALILIKGTKHTSKSQLAMQFANGFGALKMKVAYLDYEQGGMSCKDTQNSVKWNLKNENKPYVAITGYVENPLQELEDVAKEVDVFIADSVTDLGITADELNYLRKTYPKVIWIFISQVKENGTMYGGNKMAHNPTAIIQCHPAKEPEERYATLEKNRGNDLSICFDIFKQKAFVWKDVTKKKDDEEYIVRERKYI